jgi:hypothetical protein
MKERSQRDSTSLFRVKFRKKSYYGGKRGWQRGRVSISGEANFEKLGEREKKIGVGGVLEQGLTKKEGERSRGPIERIDLEGSTYRCKVYGTRPQRAYPCKS